MTNAGQRWRAKELEGTDFIHFENVAAEKTTENEIHRSVRCLRAIQMVQCRSCGSRSQFHDSGENDGRFAAFEKIEFSSASSN
jgi:hypothetical protein